MTTVHRLFYDAETGETVMHDVNPETGEPAWADTMSCNPDHEANRFCINRPKREIKFPKGYNTKSRKFESLKESIIAGSNKISPRMLLIPTVVVFPGFLCIILTILEIYLHVRCHRKNKELKMQSLYYQSPFHMVTRIFCGLCRESDSASTIGQIQDKRHVHHNYLKRIVI